MSEALRCDGPGCDKVDSSALYLGWWLVENASPVVIVGQPNRLDFCSWACLGAFVMEKSGDIAELARRVEELG